MPMNARVARFDVFRATIMLRTCIDGVNARHRATLDFAFDNSFHDKMEGFYAPAEAAKPSAPKLLAFNYPLAPTAGA